VGLADAGLIEATGVDLADTEAAQSGSDGDVGEGEADGATVCVVWGVLGKLAT
jgi:hypothetical protein